MNKITNKLCEVLMCNVCFVVASDSKLQSKNVIVKENLFPYCADDNKHFESLNISMQKLV